MSLIHVRYQSVQQEKLNIHSLEFHPEMLRLLAELGIIEIHGEAIAPEQLARVYKVLRLRSCLGVNLPGAAVILELLDRIEELQEEIKKLQKAR